MKTTVDEFQILEQNRRIHDEVEAEIYDQRMGVKHDDASCATTIAELERVLGGPLPKRIVRKAPLPKPAASVDQEFAAGSATNSFVNIISASNSSNVITPFVEQQAIWEQISNPLGFQLSGNTLVTKTPPWPAFGPRPGDYTYPPAMTEISAFRCPSDPGTGLPAMGRTNYAGSLGDSFSKSESGPVDQYLKVEQAAAEWTRAGQRGMFVPHMKLSFKDVLDGLSNTILAGEINTDLGDRDVTTDAAIFKGSKANPSICKTDGSVDPARPRFWAAATATIIKNHGSIYGRGYEWTMGETMYTAIHTILPPNSTVCWQGEWAGQEGIAPPSSRHQGGCHVLMGDGAIKFITDSIESGNQNTMMVEYNQTGTAAPGSKSPYGLWGALGTRAVKETISADF